MNTRVDLSQLFENMWKDYCALNPQALAVFETLRAAGETVINDHIALRTFSHPELGIAPLAQHFLKKGYRLAGEYEFPEKKLRAQHFSHSDDLLPKVFISELDLTKCSSFLQCTVELLVTEMDLSAFNDEAVLYSGRGWTAHYQTYQKLAEESEYAAWVYAHGFRPNHFTVNVNFLNQLKQMTDLNSFLKAKGFPLNESGGEIKGSPADYLEQSSTMANLIPVSFSEGVFQIPACYYEFAKRYPMANGKLFQGFVSKSADKIFESTDRLRN